MRPDNYEIIGAMRTFGGSFAVALAEAWLKADPLNRMRIQRTWPELWMQYEQMAEQQKRGRSCT